MAQDLEAIRRDIQAMHERIQTATYYEIMGVDPATADSPQFKKQLTAQFRDLARKWHVDRYSALEQGPDRTKLQQIFTTINNAHQTLADPARRAQYDLELEGPPTDIGSIINAETAFRKGQNMLETGSYKGAHLQFKIASEANPDDPEYQAHFLYTEYLLISKDDQGRPHDTARARAIRDELASIGESLKDKDWLMVFQGVVDLGLGREREATHLFQEAVILNPKNHTAQRQLRILEMRKNRKKGFFEALAEKLNFRLK